MFTLCLIIERFFLLIFAFAHHHATHSIFLSITLFHYVPHVLILSKCLRGSSLVLPLRYSNNFFVILQKKISMFEINMYSIIDSKVFGVTIGENVFFAIGVKRFYDCKHMVE
jgi:hypothetical protein